MLKYIAQSLSAIDPEHAEDYQNNANEMIGKIQAADQKITQDFINIKNKPYLVFHDAWSYFENHYQLQL